jgi:hypothetical protein
MGELSARASGVCWLRLLGRIAEFCNVKNQIVRFAGQSPVAVQLATVQLLNNSSCGWLVLLGRYIEARPLDTLYTSRVTFSNVVVYFRRWMLLDIEGWRLDLGYWIFQILYSFKEISKDKP